MEDIKEYSKTCMKCSDGFSYTEEDAKWHECSTYSVKVVKCPHCKAVNVLRYIEDSGLHVNTDERYYK